jgi:hypothetical protein
LGGRPQRRPERRYCGRIPIRLGGMRLDTFIDNAVVGDRIIHGVGYARGPGATIRGQGGQRHN